MNRMNDFKSDDEPKQADRLVTLTMTSLEAAQLGILASVGAQTIANNPGFTETHRQAALDSIGTMERLSVIVSVAQAAVVERRH